MAFRSREQRLARAVDRHLANAVAEIGRSVGWRADVRGGPVPPLTPSLAGNLVIAGIFADYHDEAAELQGHRPSMTIPTLQPAAGAGDEFTPMLVRGMRVAVRREEGVARLVYRVVDVDPDGLYRQLVWLHALGFECTDVETHGFPYPLPIEFVGRGCIDLDGPVSLG